MNGLRLTLPQHKQLSPGRWFWSCFAPLRAEFNRHFWLVPLQPWMGPPDGFESGAWTVDYPGAGDTELGLWRPGAMGRWADRFAEESIALMAVRLSDDPSKLASEFARVPWRAQDAWMAVRAEFFLRYTDGTSWDMYARQAESVDAIKSNLVDNDAIRWQAAPTLV
ncbi:MAG: hypothetical protein ACOYPS_07230 [Phycisphaerales bacterium]